MNGNSRSLWVQAIAVGFLASACLAGSISTAAAQDEAAALRIVADQVRSQGFPCDNPSSAERDEAASVPNETVYILKCEGVAYRVVLIPDQAAVVTQVE